jgi:monothiol glutaredoxin
MKGTPDYPKCGFSRYVTQVLQYHGVPFTSLDVLEDEDLRDGIKKFSNWPTIPQLYIKKEFIGGCDIVKEMHENGELEKLLQEKEVL